MIYQFFICLRLSDVQAIFNFTPCFYEKIPEALRNYKLKKVFQNTKEFDAKNI